MKKYLDNRGYLLPSVVMFIIVTLILGSSLLYLGQTERVASRRRLNRERALYAAEAGIHRAYAHIKEDINWRPENIPVAFGDGEFDVSVVEGHTTLNLISTGTFRGTSETVKLLTSKQLSGGGVFVGGIFGTERVELKGNVEISGYDSRDPGAEPKPPAYVGSNSSVHVQGASRILGDSNPNENRILNPIHIPPELLNMDYTAGGDPGLSGSYSIDAGHNYTATGTAGISAGDYRFNNFALSSSAAKITITGTVRLLIEGALTMNANFASISLAEDSELIIYLDSSPDHEGQNPSSIDITGGTINSGGRPHNVAIYSATDKNINFEGNADVTAVVYAPSVTVTAATGTPVFRGAIVANRLEASGNVRILHDVSLGETIVTGDPGATIEGLRIIRWTKGWASLP